MEKKVSRRIAGSLIIVALVVILLPLFNSGTNKSLISSASIQAPAFPASTENTTTVASNESPVMPESQSYKIVKDIMAADKNLPALVSANETQPAVITTAEQAIPSAANKKPDAVAKVIPSSLDAKPEAQAVLAKNAKPEAKSEAKTVLAKDTKSAEAVKATAGEKKSVNLAALKNPAWVVQMGSFRNKNNAARLTNALRSKGYKAFTYETKSNNQVRVYVGPELKKVAAANLATKIKEDIKLEGLVLTYKPLEI
ncbi:MAG: SPOR domain-containing protein [Gammaproteobacteria bacterium]|nr:SPOR domain-containing protein [Gammaproteobacteria bacterium]